MLQSVNENKPRTGENEQRTFLPVGDTAYCQPVATRFRVFSCGRECCPVLPFWK